MIPEFNEHGLLPPGIHDCTLAEVGARFCWTTHRQAQFDHLQQFLAVELVSLPSVFRLYVDGSFVRNKPLPGDVDVVIELDGSISEPEAAVLILRLQVTERQRFKDVYNLDVWLKHPALKSDLVAFFQYAGDKAAAELHIPCHHHKGILRISP